MTSVNDIQAQLRSQIAEPGTEGTRAEREAELNRWLADCLAQSKRLDEENLILGLGWSAAVCMTHELVWDWQTATADRWYQALPERYMTRDAMARPDWDHSHYEHDEHGHIGRVTTRERPKTQADTAAEQLVARILADIDDEEDN